jgi:hypothetical protein
MHILTNNNNNKKCTFENFKHMHKYYCSCTSPFRESRLFFEYFRQGREVFMFPSSRWWLPPSLLGYEVFLFLPGVNQWRLDLSQPLRLWRFVPPNRSSTDGG